MITLTQKEKADRFDALQSAINLTIGNYEGRIKREGIEADRHKDSHTAIYAMHIAYKSAYEDFVATLKRWV